MWRLWPVLEFLIALKQQGVERIRMAQNPLRTLRTPSVPSNQEKHKQGCIQSRMETDATDDQKAPSPMMIWQVGLPASHSVNTVRADWPGEAQGRHPVTCLARSQIYQFSAAVPQVFTLAMMASRERRSNMEIGWR